MQLFFFILATIHLIWTLYNIIHKMLRDWKLYNTAYKIIDFMTILGAFTMYAILLSLIYWMK